MTFNTDKKTYGSKAASLKWLETAISAGEKFLGHDTWRVPTFYTYPIVSPDTKPLPKAVSMPSYANYAVRSGSNVSLPGLMDTVLNVPGEQVPSVVRRVYKSFNNKAVQRFIENMEYPPKGTGVIVQKMVPNNHETIFGVVFTCSPKGFPDPYLIYSDSPGEIVGTGQGQKKPAHPNFRWLALRWYEQFGTPPEIEIAYRDINGRGIWYLLQIRDQKLTLSEKAAMEGRVLKAPDISPVFSITGDGWAKITEPDQVACIEKATPDVTLEHIRDGARLVVAKEGNPYSHAAVIARTEGVGFGIGEVPLDSLELPYTYMDGNFYLGEVEPEFVEDTRDFELISSKSNWCILKGLIHGGICPYELSEELPQLFISTLIRYKSYLFGEGPPEYLVEFAQVLSFLGYLTSLGETRHETRFGLLGVQKKGERKHLYSRALGGDFDRPLEWLKFAKDIFKEGKFPGGGYGGFNWISIAERSIELAEILTKFKEEPNRVTFSELEMSVTQAENQMHNCAIFWDKFYSGRIGLEILNRFSFSNNWENFIERLEKLAHSMDFYSKETKLVQGGIHDLMENSLHIMPFAPVDDPKHCMGEYPGYDKTVKNWMEKEEARKQRIQMNLEKAGKLAKKVHIVYKAEKEEKSEKEVSVEMEDPLPFEFDSETPNETEEPDIETLHMETLEIPIEGEEITTDTKDELTCDDNSIASTDTEEYHDGTKPKRKKEEV